ncbi:hypothetical protein Ancab_004332 [Ancistrocladus abbreviatus]
MRVSVGMMTWENELKKILQFIHEVPEWINYNNEIEELVRSLKIRLERLDCMVNDVEELVQLKEFQLGKKRRREVDDWLRNVRSKKVDVQNMENHISGASIAKAMELEMNDTDTRKRAARTCSALKMNRFVLILDDLSLFFTTDEVGIPLEENKGKLILATQPPLVCRRMRCQEVIKLEPFPYEDAEKFFMKKLGLSDYPSEEIKKIAGDIIHKCGGIPSKIQTMAVNLRGVDDIHELRSTFSDMED